MVRVYERTWKIMATMMLQNVSLSNESLHNKTVGGRNPKNGVNHVYLCLLMHLLYRFVRLCFMYLFLHCDIVSYGFFFISVISRFTLVSNDTGCHQVLIWVKHCWSIKVIDYVQILRRGFDFNGFVNLLIVHAIRKWEQLLH